MMVVVGQLSDAQMRTLQAVKDRLITDDLARKANKRTHDRRARRKRALERMEAEQATTAVPAPIEEMVMEVIPVPEPVIIRA